MHHRMFSSIPGIYPLDVSIISFPQLWQPKVSLDIDKCPLGVGRQDHPCLRTTAFQEVMYPPILELSVACFLTSYKWIHKYVFITSGFFTQHCVSKVLPCYHMQLSFVHSHCCLVFHCMCLPIFILSTAGGHLHPFQFWTTENHTA